MTTRTSLHTSVKRLLLTGVAALATSGGLLALASAPASAAGVYHTTGSVNLRTGPGTGNAIITTVPAGTSFALVCQWQGGTPVNGNATWDMVQLSNGTVGALADYWTNTPSFNSFAPGTGDCVTQAPVRRTTAANHGYPGQCVWYVLNRFHQATGVYPYTTGNAWNFANSAGANGWTVSAAPRVRSVAVFQPGVNGAGSFGHVAWVEQVSGGRIQVAEMNWVGPWVESRRWLTPGPSVRYVYAP